MDTLRVVLLLLATLSMGLGAGTFVLFAHTVMPGLRKEDDRNFVATFQILDAAILNPWFMITTFLGSLVLTIAGAVTHLGQASLPWIVAALALYAITFVVTFAVNVPLNNALKNAGPPDQISDLAAVRTRFNETRWVRWNLVRVVTTTGAFALLAWALVVYGRADGG